MIEAVLVTFAGAELVATGETSEDTVLLVAEVVAGTVEYSKDKVIVDW